MGNSLPMLVQENDAAIKAARGDVATVDKALAAARQTYEVSRHTDNHDDDDDGDGDDGGGNDATMLRMLTMMNQTSSS
jgi:hypothetical protein